MLRKSVRHVVRIAIIVAGLCVSLAAAAERPNVVILLADDLGYGDIGCFGAPIRTPNIDRLASEGVRFTDYYSAAPNCSPSRAGLLTGRTPGRIGIYDYIDPGSPMHLPPEEVTIAEMLKPLGYDTCHVGKWHLSSWERDPQAPLQPPTPGDQGFDYWFAVDNNSVPTHLNPLNFIRNGTPVGELKGYSCQLVVDEGIRWLKGRADQSKPFFLNVCFNEPHHKIASPPELIKTYPGVDKQTAKYYANVTNMDAAAGRVLAALDELGKRENTLVLFMSDNGPWRDGSSGPLRAKKSSLYEGGIRVPGIMRWPGTIEAGRVSSVPVGAVDFFPTVAEIVGATQPVDKHIDGTSLLPLLHGGELTRAQPLFWLFYKSTPMCAIRVGKYSLIANPRVTYKSKSHPFDQTDFDYVKSAVMEHYELYDLETDIGQQHDLGKELAGTAESLFGEMQQIHTGVIAEGVVWQGLWEK
jgi:arylsulfatase A